MVRLCEFINSVNKMDKDRIWCVLQFENTWYVKNRGTWRAVCFSNVWRYLTPDQKINAYYDLTQAEAEAMAALLNAGEENV